MRKPYSVRIVTTVLLASLLAACGNERITQELTGSTMGTSFRIQIVDPDKALDLENLKADISTLLQGIEQSMSTYLPDSEVSRFNTTAANQWFDVSARLCEVIEGAQNISALSGGAFDVTVGATVNLWGFGPGEAVMVPPDAERIAALLEGTGYDKLHTDCTQPALRKDADAIYVDLSGFAKGYAVDQLAALLNANGVADYLVEIGGEVRGSGKNGAGRNWAIAIESPKRDARDITRVVPLANAGMATSGDYRIYFENAGKFYSHTIDPRSGYPVSHAAAAVTVVADTTAFADGMATALLVLGPVDGMLLAEQQGIAALYQLRNGELIDERMSSRFAAEFATQ